MQHIRCESGDARRRAASYDARCRDATFRIRRKRTVSVLVSVKIKNEKYFLVLFCSLSENISILTLSHVLRLWAVIGAR